MTQHKILFAAAALLALAACDSRQTGTEGNLTFEYDADDDPFDFNKPVAVGAMLDLRVTEVGTDDPVTLTSATTDDLDVMEAGNVNGNTFTVSGIGDGDVLVSVEAETSDGPVTDSVNMSVRFPEVLVLSHTCGETGGAYLTGQRIYVPFDMELESGRAVIGYGYYPVGISDTNLMTRDEAFAGQQFMRFDTLSAGTVTLASDIDDTTLDLVLADAAAIDGAEDPIPFVLEDIDVGDVNAFYVRPTIGGQTVCQANTEIVVEALTETTCAVRTIGDDLAAGDARYETGWFEIEGLAAGTCQYTVTYPQGSNGAGTTVTYAYEIQP